MHTYILTHTHTYIHTYIHICIHTCIHTVTYLYRYIYIHLHSLPEFRERALTFSGSPSLLRRSRYHQCLEEEESSQSRPNGSPVLLKDDSTDSGDRDLTDVNKMPHGYMYSNRRNSFLYLSDTEDAVSKPVSRNSSISR